MALADSWATLVATVSNYGVIVLDWFNTYFGTIAVLLILIWAYRNRKKISSWIQGKRERTRVRRVYVTSRKRKTY